MPGLRQENFRSCSLLDCYEIYKSTTDKIGVKINSTMKIANWSSTAAYGNRFVPIDSEDLSHERAFPSKPTKKPHQRKQKTSSTPPDSTVMHKEHTESTLNQVRSRYKRSKSYASSIQSPVALLTLRKCWVLDELITRRWFFTLLLAIRGLTLRGDGYLGC